MELGHYIFGQSTFTTCSSLV